MTDTTTTDRTTADARGAAGGPPAPTVWPSLRARDARALIAFLVDAFGFEATAVFGEGPDVQHAQLDWPLGGGVMLGSAREDGAADGGVAVAPGRAAAYVVTDAPDALLARATAAGAHLVRPLEDTEYGSRQFSVRDPEGNVWSFGTYRGEPRHA
jgi:uncharacterized glyoxalase superfamily protein PhnB